MEELKNNSRNISNNSQNLKSQLFDEDKNKCSNSSNNNISK